MKTLSIFLLSGMFLFLAHTHAAACSLNPTAKIVTDPSGSTFFHGDPVVFDGTTSTANCGSISQYRWRVRPVGGSYTTVSWSSVYSHTFTLEPHEGEKDYQVQLRVRNSAGKYGFKTITVTVKRHYTRQYYLTDHLGSVRVTVNEQGDAVGWDDYYPFGLQMPGRTQNATNPNDDQKFTGYLLEQEGDLGIYHAEARMYDPVIGRFNSVDPLAGEFPGWSPYNYVMNNPIRLVDPDGRAPMDDYYLIGGRMSVVETDGPDRFFYEDVKKGTYRALNLDDKADSKILGDYFRANDKIFSHAVSSGRLGRGATVEDQGTYFAARMQSGGSAALLTTLEVTANAASVVSMLTGVGTLAGAGTQLFRARGAIQFTNNMARRSIQASVAETTTRTAAVPVGGSLDAAFDSGIRTGTSFGIGAGATALSGVRATGLAGPAFRSSTTGQFVRNSYGFRRNAAAYGVGTAPGILWPYSQNR